MILTCTLLHNKGKIFTSNSNITAYCLKNKMGFNYECVHNTAKSVRLRSKHYKSELVNLPVVCLDAAASVGAIFLLLPVYQCQPQSLEVMNAGKRAMCRSHVFAQTEERK